MQTKFTWPPKEFKDYVESQIQEYIEHQIEGIAPSSDSPQNALRRLIQPNVVDSLKNRMPKLIEAHGEPKVIAYLNSVCDYYDEIAHLNLIRYEKYWEWLRKINAKSEELACLLANGPFNTKSEEQACFLANGPFNTKSEEQACFLANGPFNTKSEEQARPFANWPYETLLRVDWINHLDATLLAVLDNYGDDTAIDEFNLKYTALRRVTKTTPLHFFFEAVARLAALETIDAPVFSWQESFHIDGPKHIGDSGKKGIETITARALKRLTIETFDAPHSEIVADLLNRLFNTTRFDSDALNHIRL